MHLTSLASFAGRRKVETRAAALPGRTGAAETDQGEAAGDGGAAQRFALGTRGENLRCEASMTPEVHASRDDISLRGFSTWWTERDQNFLLRCKGCIHPPPLCHVCPVASKPEQLLPPLVILESSLCMPLRSRTIASSRPSCLLCKDRLS